MQNKRQSIETAPKDGTKIILFGGEIKLLTDYGEDPIAPKNINNAVIASYDSFGHYEKFEWMCEVLAHRGTIYCIEPTHWMYAYK